MTCEDPDPIPGADCAVGLGSTRYNTTVGGNMLPTTINPFVDPRPFGWGYYPFGEEYTVPIDQPFYRGNGKFFANPVPGEEPERIIVTVRSPAENGLAFMPIIVSPVEIRDAATGLEPQFPFFGPCDEWREVTPVETNPTILNRESIWRDTIIADGSAWVTDFNAGFVFRLDAETGELIERIPVNGGPFRMVYAYGDIWVTQLWLGAAVRISTSTNTVVAHLPDISKNAYDIADAGGFIWVSDPERDRVYKIDPFTNQAVSNVTIPNAGFLAFDGDVLWVTVAFPPLDVIVGGELYVRSQLALRSIDVVTGTVHQFVVDPVPEYRSPKDLSFDGFHLWYGDSTRLYRIDSNTEKALARYDVPFDAVGATASPNGKLWTQGRGYDITGEIIAGSVNLGGTTLTTVAYAFGDWWVGNVDGTLFRVDGATSVVSDIISIGSIPPYIGSAGYITSICADSTFIYVTAELVTPSGPPHFHYLFKINPSTGLIVDQTYLAMYDSRAVFYDGDVWAVGSAVTTPADHMVKRVNASTMTVVDDFYIETGVATCLIAAGDSQVVISNRSTKMWYFDTTESNLPDYPDYEFIAISSFFTVNISSLIYDGQNFCISLSGITAYSPIEYGTALARKVGPTWEKFDFGGQPNYFGGVAGLASDGQDYWYSVYRGGSYFIRSTQISADVFVAGFGPIAVSAERVAICIGAYLYLIDRGDEPVDAIGAELLCKGVMNGDTLLAASQDGRLVSVDTNAVTISYSEPIPLSDFDQLFTGTVFTSAGRENYWVSPILGPVTSLVADGGKVYALHGATLTKLGSDGRVISQLTGLDGGVSGNGAALVDADGALGFACGGRFGVIGRGTDESPEMSIQWVKTLEPQQNFGSTSIGLAFGDGLAEHNNDLLRGWLFVISNNNTISAHYSPLGNSSPGFVIDLNEPTIDWSDSYKAQGVVANDALWVNGGTKLFRIDGDGLTNPFSQVSTYLVDEQGHSNDIVDISASGTADKSVIWVAYGGSVGDDSGSEVDERGSLTLVDADTSECRQIAGAAATGGGVLFCGLASSGNKAYAIAQVAEGATRLTLLSATINDFDNIWDVEFISEYYDERSSLTNSHIPLAIDLAPTSGGGLQQIYAAWSDSFPRDQIRRFSLLRFALVAQPGTLTIDDASNRLSQTIGVGGFSLGWTGQFNQPARLNLAQGETVSVLISNVSGNSKLLIAGDASLDALLQGVFEPDVGNASWTPSVDEQLEIVCVEWVYGGGRASVGIIIV